MAKKVTSKNNMHSAKNKGKYARVEELYRISLPILDCYNTSHDTRKNLTSYSYVRNCINLTKRINHDGTFNLILKKSCQTIGYTKEDKMWSSWKTTGIHIFDVINKGKIRERRYIPSKKSWATEIFYSGAILAYQKELNETYLENYDTPFMRILESSKLEKGEYPEFSDHSSFEPSGTQYAYAILNHNITMNPQLLGASKKFIPSENVLSEEELDKLPLFLRQAYHKVNDDFRVSPLSSIASGKTEYSRVMTPREMRNMLPHDRMVKELMNTAQEIHHNIEFDVLAASLMQEIISDKDSHSVIRMENSDRDKEAFKKFVKLFGINDQNSLSLDDVNKLFSYESGLFEQIEKNLYTLICLELMPFTHFVAYPLLHQVDLDLVVQGEHIAEHSSYGKIIDINPKNARMHEIFYGVEDYKTLASRLINHPSPNKALVKSITEFFNPIITEDEEELCRFFYHDYVDKFKKNSWPKKNMESIYDLNKRGSYYNDFDYEQDRFNALYLGNRKKFDLFQNLLAFSSVVPQDYVTTYLKEASTLTSYRNSMIAQNSNFIERVAFNKKNKKIVEILNNFEENKEYYNEVHAYLSSNNFMTHSVRSSNIIKKLPSFIRRLDMRSRKRLMRIVDENNMPMSGDLAFIRDLNLSMRVWDAPTTAESWHDYHDQLDAIARYNTNSTQDKEEEFDEWRLTQLIRHMYEFSGVISVPRSILLPLNINKEEKIKTYSILEDKLRKMINLHNKEGKTLDEINQEQINNNNKKTNSTINNSSKNTGKTIKKKKLSYYDSMKNINENLAKKRIIDENAILWQNYENLSDKEKKSKEFSQWLNRDSSSLYEVKNENNSRTLDYSYSPLQNIPVHVNVGSSGNMLRSWSNIMDHCIWSYSNSIGYSILVSLNVHGMMIGNAEINEKLGILPIPIDDKKNPLIKGANIPQNVRLIPHINSNSKITKPYINKNSRIGKTYNEKNYSYGRKLEFGEQQNYHDDFDYFDDLDIEFEFGDDKKESPQNNIVITRNGNTEDFFVVKNQLAQLLGRHNQYLPKELQESFAEFLKNNHDVIIDQYWGKE